MDMSLSEKNKTADEQPSHGGYFMANQEYGADQIQILEGLEIGRAHV